MYTRTVNSNDSHSIYSEERVHISQVLAAIILYHMANRQWEKTNTLIVYTNNEL
jgi:hypothetical protein